MADPISYDEIYDMYKDGHKDLLVTINNEVYNAEDLPTCDTCGEYALELVDGWICGRCEQEGIDIEAPRSNKHSFKNVL